MTGSKSVAWSLMVPVLLASCGGDDPVTPGPVGVVNQAPTASFTADVAGGPAPLTVRFDGTGSADPDGTIASYAWSFGDGATGTGATVVHVYTEPGAFTPTLTVTDQRGATANTTGDRITVSSPAGTGSNSISGIVWHDADADATRDADEDVVPDMVVFLDLNENAVRDSGEPSAVTDDNGAYLFEGLDSGRTYRVTQELTIGWTNTVAGIGAAGVGAVTTHVQATAAGPVLAAAGPGMAASKPARIIGGQQAAAGEFPFQVALLTNTDFQTCGGTWIAARWVLTASHCVDGGLAPSSRVVLAGTADLRTGGERLAIERFILHPNYSATAFVENDIALIELTEDYMYPRVELLTPDRATRAAPGVMATVIGWGRTGISAGTGSSVLKKLTAAIISNDTCTTTLGQNILPVTICAGMSGSNESVCNGDSGGPLLVPFRDRWLQTGIVSFGSNICFQPTAFARVSALIDFVRQHVAPEASKFAEVDWTTGTDVRVDFGDFR